MKIALVHDYLASCGGAEQVLAALHELYPEAPIYTLFSRVDQEPLLKQKFAKAKIIPSWFGKLPFATKIISPLRFLIPLIWRSFDFSDDDLVISSASWAITKGFTSAKTKEVCYCHTPPRYLYGYETARNWQKHWYIRLYALVVNHLMRQYDWRQAQKVTQFVANSREVQARIKKFYRRESVVINPPIEIPPHFAKASRGKREYFLTGGRLEAAKNFGLIVKACNQLKLPLKIYGSGSQEGNLRRLAGSTIEFLGRISEQDKFGFMAGCRAFVVAAKDEDFGITPVEAMAVGRPVVAYRGGGYLETVVEGKTGVFFDELTVSCLAPTLKSFQSGKYRSQDCRRQAEKFNKQKFQQKIGQLVSKLVLG